MLTTSIKNKTCECRVCGDASIKIFHGALLDLTVSYYECPNCHYVQTENPYWLERAYLKAINLSDTGIMARNIVNSRITLSTLICLKKTKGTVVDYAGGYGILVRLLRDNGINAFWFDRYCQNLLASGFEYAQHDDVDLITAFEAFEHFVNPPLELESLLAIAPNILLSTEIISTPTPSLGEWWYYGSHHGQHIGFFRIKTLEFLAKKYNKYLSTDGRKYHFFSENKPKLKSWNFLINRHINRLTPLYSRLYLPSKTESDNQKLSNLP
ncbi:MAG: methyltransferase domain-containing protein [Methylomonas sp.]